MDKLKVGVLGLRRGRTHLDNFLRIENCVVAGAADQYEIWREPQRAKVEAAGGKLVREFEELLDLKLDAVVVATNARVHTDHAIQAMEAGCHVMCEIPVSFHEEELSRLRDAAERTGKMYMAAENLCFMDFLRYWRKWVVEGRFGDLALAHCEYVHYLPETMLLPDGRRLTPRQAQAEGLANAVPIWRADQPPIQYLTHDLGPLLEVFDDRAVSVTCMSSETHCADAPLRPDGQIALFKTAKGRVIQCTVTLNTKAPGGHRFRMWGTEGAAEWFSYEEKCRVAFGGGDKERWTWTRLGLAAEGDDASAGHGGVDLVMAKAFVNAALGGKPSPIDVYRGIDYTLPGIRAARSAEQGGAPVDIPDLRRAPFAGTRLWDYFPLPERAELADVAADRAPSHRGNGA